MWTDSREEKIRQLENELSHARRTILNLLPEPILAKADMYYSLRTREDARKWEEALVESVIELALPFAVETYYSGTRANCPLCKCGTSGPYVEGFKLPDGLRRHLLGEGNAHPCNVLHAVIELARGSWLPHALKAEAEYRAEQEAIKAARQERETLYRIGPRSEAVLLDEGLWWGGEPRSEESVSWAIARLLDLGFTETRTGNVTEFTKAHDTVVIYADIRTMGRMNFNVFRSEQVSKPQSRKRWVPDHTSFYLLDTWKNDLETKLKERITQALPLLGPRSKRC